jgi:hypothetical protein
MVDANMREAVSLTDANAYASLHDLSEAFATIIDELRKALAPSRRMLEMRRSSLMGWMTAEF